MDETDLSRFLEAQADTYARAAEELSAGHKRTHWMWFIFPQLAGLGLSPIAQRYAIRDIGEARRYLDHLVLGGRLRDAVRLVLGHKGESALAIFGAPDDLKFRSCVTLFREAASDHADRALFGEALEHFYEGRPDPRTLQLLRG